MPRVSFFDRRAKHWEETYYPPPVRVRLCALIQEFGLAEGERVLDIGTGPGVLIPYLRELVGASGQVCAFDLSFEMVRQAYRKPRTSVDIIIQADVHHIPFSDNTFDRVICFAAFPHFKDPLAAVHEMSRVLKKGGILIIAHLMSREELSMHHASCPDVAGDVLPVDHRMRSFFVEAGLLPLDIINMPGRYLARGVKRGPRMRDGPWGR